MPAASRTRRAGRPAQFDRESVIAAAVDLLDEDGPRALTMAALAKRMGVTPMALYRVVADRQDLESALVAHVFVALTSPQDSDQPWDDAIATWMRRLRQCWLRHPWAGDFIGSADQLAPGFLSALDALVGYLEQAGLTPDQVAREMIRVSDVTIGVLFSHSTAPLPHAAAVSKALLESEATADRSRWAPIEAALAEYGGDEFFEDLISWTLERIRSTLAAHHPTMGGSRG